MTDKNKNDDNIVRNVPFGDKPGKCPNCGSHKTVLILYGYPTEGALGEAQQGKIELGGCVITGNDPKEHCTECNHRW